METFANIAALILLIGAGYLLTVRTWHQKNKIEDFVGRFDQQIDDLIHQFAPDPEKEQTSDQRIDRLSHHVMVLAGIVANKIKQDHRAAKDDIARAKTGILLLMLATFIQILIVIFG
jgi:hypothetical protein